MDIQKENRFILMEEWKTRGSLEKHFYSHQFSILLGTKTLLTEPMDMKVLTIVNIERPFDFASLRVDNEFKKNNGNSGCVQ